MTRFFPFLLLLLASTAYPVLAQQVVSGQPSGQQIDRNGDRLPTEEQKDFNRRVLRGEEPSPTERPHEPRLAEAQIRADFRQLQISNNQMQARAAESGTRDQSLLKPLAEIRRCARRLKANLVLSAAKGTAKAAGAQEPAAETSPAVLLQGLDESVKSFVRNPMFGSVKVLDVQLTQRAAADLERVITLSEALADRLRQAER